MEDHQAERALEALQERVKNLEAIVLVLLRHAPAEALLPMQRTLELEAFPAAEDAIRVGLENEAQHAP